MNTTMGAGSSSCRLNLFHQLSHHSQLAADTLTTEGRVPLQSLTKAGRRHGHWAVGTVAPPMPTALQTRPLSGSSSFRSCRGGVGWPAFSIAQFCSGRQLEEHSAVVSVGLRLHASAGPGGAAAARETPLQAFLQQFGARSASPVVDWDVARWVVFSDLHLSRRTLDVCLETLLTVHREATDRDAGVLFLGDFWHERGALPVEPLNQVLQVIQAWQRPMLMIPGNHDQVSIGGDVHSLTPLEAASPFIRVLHEPTVLLGALFVPYRRDHELVLEAMRGHKDVKAVFAHIDVVGAFLNNSFQAKDGIRPEELRSDVPIYTGHYHKPHRVDGSSVQYLGSPYQVSRGEAGQQKQLLVLDREWKEAEVIPLSVGPRHFSVSGATPSLPEDLRAGDRLRWEVPAEWTLQVKKTRASKKEAPNPVAEILAGLRSQGVDVELVYPLPKSKPRIQKAEEMDAFSLFLQYATTAGLSAAAAARGHALLRELDLPAKALSRPRADVVFRQLEMEAYGPFLAPTRYCLGPARGLRAITGDIQDAGQGTDSNGAGKTTLVMAPLWALTGSTDSRPGAEGGLLLSEVVHQETTSGRVRLEGDVNGRPFVVERTAGRRSGLRFEYDGEDRTQQEMRLTQEKINDLIDTAALRRTVFHGQHAMGGLLEANDRDLKEELSALVSMEVWVAAADAAKRLLKTKRTQLEHLHGAAGELVNRTDALQIEIKRTEVEQAEFAVWRASQVSELEERLASSRVEQAARLRQCLEAAVRLDACIAETSAVLSAWEDSTLGDAMGPAWAGPTPVVSPEEEEAAVLAQDAQMELVDKRAQARGAAAAARAARARLASFSAANADAVVCERCLQPVAGEHLATSIAAMREDLAQHDAQYEQLQQEVAELEDALQGLHSYLAQQRAERDQVEAERRKEEEMRRATARQERQELQHARGVVATAERDCADASSLDPVAFERMLERVPATTTARADATAAAPGPRSGVESIAERAGTALERLQELRAVVQEDESAARAAATEVGALERRLEEVATAGDPQQGQMDTLQRMAGQAQAELTARQSEIASGEQEAGVLRAVEVAVGLAGIQSYVLEGALAELEARTAALLDTLSGGSLTLQLAATKVGKTTKREQEKINKVVQVRLPDGRLVQRSLRQLSGGERQRVAVALQLAFADFAAERSGVHSDLIVLDEAFQHLDSSGRSRMLSVLRGLAQGSVLVVSQANGELAGMFDLVDTVVKANHAATVQCA